MHTNVLCCVINKSKELLKAIDPGTVCNPAHAHGNIFHMNTMAQVCWESLMEGTSGNSQWCSFTHTTPQQFCHYCHHPMPTMHLEIYRSILVVTELQRMILDTYLDLAMLTTITHDASCDVFLKAFFACTLLMNYF